MSIQEPKILCLFSAPLVGPDGKPINALDIEAERDAIIRELAACNRKITLRLGFATIDELARGIADGYNILHLSGHGHKDFLLFEDGKAGSLPVSGEYLKRLIGTGGPFELAVVSACHSENIAKLLNEAGIRHAVAIRHDVPVLDAAAIAFAGQFYSSIFRGEVIQKAFEMAKLLVEGNAELMKIKPELELRAQIEGEPFVAEEEKFVLIPRDTSSSSVHLDALISDKIPQGELEVDKVKLSKSNIPVRPQSFTGRSSEMHGIINDLLANRLATITGAGGIGKTTLAMEAARWFHSRGHFTDGIFHIDLRHVDTAGGVIDALGCAVETPFEAVEDLISYLKERQCLLVFDNAEDILWKDETILHDIFNAILRSTPSCKLLVTSQRHVGGDIYEPEKMRRLESMGLHCGALLFYGTAKRGLTMEELSSEAFGALLKQMGGHPLSIILMARQLVPGASIEDLIERIKKHKAKAIAVKIITDRDPEHGESLVAALSSAYENLSDDGKTLFQILSMLPAGALKFTIKQIMGDDAWEYAQEVHDKGLSEIIESPRAYLLPPIGLFARGMLSNEVKERYGSIIVGLMASYARQFYTNLGGSDAKENRFYFTMEEPNLRAAIDLPSTASKTNEEMSSLGRLSTYLIQLYVSHHRLEATTEISGRIIDKLRKNNDRLGEANTLHALGNLAMRKDELADAKDRYENGLDIFKEIDAKLGEANTLKALGDLAMRKDELADAKDRYENAMDIYKEIDQKLGEANTLRALGNLAMRKAELADAKDRYESALDIYKEIDEKMGEANTLQALGDLAMRKYEFADAKDRYESAMDIFKEIDEKMGEANTLQALGDLAMRKDELADAKDRYENALDIYKEIDEKMGEANTLKALGDLAMRKDELADAKDRYENAMDIYKEIDGKLGEANVIMLLGRLFGFNGDLDSADRNFETAIKIYKEIEDMEGQADVHMGQAFVLIKREFYEEARAELVKCSSIHDKVFGYGEAAQWLILYAGHLKSQSLMDGVGVCLEYASEFALKAKDADLQKKVEELCD